MQKKESRKYLSKQSICVIFWLILFIPSINLKASDEYNNDKYSSYFVGDWHTIDIKPEQMLFTIIRHLKINFMEDYLFFAEADFVFGIYKKWYGDYKVSSDKLFLAFDNGARETLYYNKINEHSLICTQPNKITLNLVKTPKPQITSAIADIK